MHRYFAIVLMAIVTVPIEAENVKEDRLHYGYEEGDFLFADSTKSHLLACTNDSISEVLIPNGVKHIADEVFIGKQSMKSVTIPEGVLSIGKEAFAYCFYIDSARLVIPNSVTEIGANAFAGSIIDLQYRGNAAGAPWGAKCVNGYREGPFLYSDTAKTCIVYCFDTINTTITIPSSVTRIDDYAFEMCSQLIDPVIPTTVTSVGKAPFSGVRNVIYHGSEELDFGSSYTNCFTEGPFIYEDASKRKIIQCESYSGSIRIPSTVQEIGDEAFYHCIIDTLFVPSSVKRLGDYVFRNWSCNYLVMESVSPPVMGKYCPYFDEENVEPDNEAVIYPDLDKYYHPKTIVIVPNQKAVWKYQETRVWEYFSIICTQNPDYSK